MAIAGNRLRGAPSYSARPAIKESPSFQLRKREATSFKARLCPLKMNKARTERRSELWEVESLRNLTTVTTMKRCEAALVVPLKAKVSEPIS
jgi:hypothetical protein